VEVAVLTGIERNELQNEVAGALYWLRILMMAVTALHSSRLLMSRCGPEFGALKVELSSARSGKSVDNFIMACTRVTWLDRKCF
jgi:hypothetical protein